MSKQKTIRLKGVPVSPGVAIGRIFHYNPRLGGVEAHQIDADKVAEEIRRFERAVEQSKEQLTQLRQRISQFVDDHYAAIFDSHVHILEDPMLIDETRTRIEEEQLNAEAAFWGAVEHIAKIFENIQDEYLRARSGDLFDVANRVLRNLYRTDIPTLDTVSEPMVVVAHDLGPSDTANMNPQIILGFAIDRGGRTSHTAIMARALEIPAVVALNDITHYAESGSQIVIDGNSGEVIVNPTQEELTYYGERQLTLRQQEERIRLEAQLPAQTLDEHIINICANIELPAEVDHALKYGADGIGLFRTEFVYLNRDALPSEEEQYQVYRRVVEKMARSTVVFRTLDLGGDKFASVISAPREFNPFMGLRAIRLCLQYPEIFRTQLRAILRAGAKAKIKLMFPLVSDLQELRQAKKVLHQVQEELTQEGHQLSSPISLGVMIEVPSAVIIADLLAREVDFFSIGTNDLIQYTFAVDRINEKVAYLYEPLHPAILRTIKQLCDVAQQYDVTVGVCGEMAADPVIATLLVGMGVSQLSMAALAIPEVKRLLRTIKFEEARELAEIILTKESPEEIKTLVYSSKCFLTLKE